MDSEQDPQAPIDRRYIEDIGGLGAAMNEWSASYDAEAVFAKHEGKVVPRFLTEEEVLTRGKAQPPSYPRSKPAASEASKNQSAETNDERFSKITGWIGGVSVGFSVLAEAASDGKSSWGFLAGIVGALVLGVRATKKWFDSWPPEGYGSR